MTDNYPAILGYIRSYAADNDGQSPSYDEMKTFLNAPSKNTVARLMINLERKGLISRIVGRARSIYVTDAGFAVMRGKTAEATNG